MSTSGFFARILKGIRSSILVGFFLTVPFAATVLIFNFLFGLATGWLPKSVLPELRTTWAGTLILQILTLLAMILILGVIGLLARNFLGRRLYKLGDAIVTRIPLMKGIYVSVRQISESLFTQRKTLFKEVVMIEYPRKGLYSLAFVTAAVPSSLSGKIGDGRDTDCVSVFIPTTPNPTSGFLILLPRRDTIALTLPVTDALTFIMSAGAVAPGEEGTVAPTLLDKLENWLRQDEARADAPLIETPPSPTDAKEGEEPENHTS